MKKYSVFMLVLILLTTSCTKETEPMHFGTMPTYSAAIYAVGVEQGFFEEAGVVVELTVFRSARDRDGAATAGQLDGFMTDIMGAINLNAKGFPFKMTSREYDDFGVMAGPNVDQTELTRPKVGLSENTVVEYITDTYLNYPVEKVAIVAIPDRMGALLAGELDYGVFPQPFMGLIMGNGGQPVVTTVQENFYPVAVVFEAAYVESHKDAVEAFYEGYEKTIDYMQSTDYDVYKEALVTYGLATSETVDFYRLPVDAYGLNMVSEKDFTDISNWMLKKGLLDNEIEFESIIDGQFIK